jgi:hypothetical protein
MIFLRQQSQSRARVSIFLSVSSRQLVRQANRIPIFSHLGRGKNYKSVLRNLSILLLPMLISDLFLPSLEGCIGH